jgi:hypothetical protein
VDFSRLPSPERTFARAAVLALALAAIGLLAGSGCQAIVTGDVPPYSCRGIDAAIACGPGKVCFEPLGECVPATAVCALLKCPDGARCDATSATCIGEAASTDAGDTSAIDANSPPRPIDASTPDDGAPVTTPEQPEASTDAAVCRSIGCRCAGPDDCDSRICGDTLTLTADVVAVTNSNVCTKPCCSSLDCDVGTVCFAAGNGGNYCVHPSTLGRDVPVGRAAAGIACGSDGECASSRCVSGTCADTCCSASAGCPTGMACALGRFPGKASFDDHYTFTCMRAAGSGKDGDTCQHPSDCRSAVCSSSCVLCGSQCRAPCRRRTECASGEICADVSLAAQTSTNDVGIFCMPPDGLLGSKTMGATCTSNSDCKAGWCDTRSSVCTDVCFGDADCQSGPAGFRCRPTTFAVNGGGSYSVLGCGL